MSDTAMMPAGDRPDERADDRAPARAREHAADRAVDRAGAGREPAPRPVAAAPRAGRVPTATELLEPGGEPSLEGVDAAALTAIIGSYVRQVYGDFRQAHREAFAALAEPPPPPPSERPFALAVLEQLVGALAAYATGGLTSLLFHSVEDKLGNEAKAALTKSLSAASAGVAKAIATPARPAGPQTPAPPAAPTNPAAATLLAEFQSRQEESLREQQGRAERRLLAASAAMSAADPGALRALAEALARKVEAPSLRAEYIRRVCTGWLQLCSAISLGARAEGEPAMPDANRAGGSGSLEWRRAHAGFVEILVDFPDEVDGLAGVAVGTISVASGPGAARILRQSGRTLGELPVYRRLWLGTQRLDRAPDVVITPDHQLEVNGRSSLLAAIALRAHGRRHDLAVEGGAEERERARLLELRPKAEPPPPAHGEPGRLGPLVDAHPRPRDGERTERDERRLVALDLRRQIRAAAAQEGARALWERIGATSTEKLS